MNGIDLGFLKSVPIIPVTGTGVEGGTSRVSTGLTCRLVFEEVTTAQDQLATETIN